MHAPNFSFFLQTAARALVLLGFLSAAALAEQEPLTVKVWPGASPGESGDLGPEVVRLSPRLDRSQVEFEEPTRLITNVSHPTVTIYRPNGQPKNRTAILIFPGGGYWDLYWQLEGEEVAAWLNTLGVTGIVLKYRVPRRNGEPESAPAPRPLQDAQRALRLVRSRCQELELDPERLGVIGFSAGGHLALSVATQFDQPSYEALDKVDEQSCRPDFAIAAYPGYILADDNEPRLKVGPRTPPVFLVHGGMDLVSSPENSIAAYAALRKAGASAELHIFATAVHGFGVRPSSRPQSAWTKNCSAWLDQLGMLAQ